MKLLEGKVAILTGSTGGLGLAQAIEYAKQGAKVVLNGLEEEALKKAKKSVEDVGGEVIAVKGDVSKKTDVQNIVKEALDAFGTVDICVNNAAILAGFKPIGEITEEEWDNIMNVNLKGVYLMTTALLPIFLEKEKGTFINISSIGGSIAGVGDAAYITSKHGLNGFTKQLTYDYGYKGIRAVALSPGLTSTPMVDYAIDSQHPQAMRQINSTPTGKVGKTEDIAFFSAYLASDKAERINGVSMHMDGGQSIGGEAKWVNPIRNK